MGEFGNAGEQSLGEKSLFVWQRWNHNLQGPFCPTNPTAIKGRERRATGKSDQSHPLIPLNKRFMILF